MKNDFFQISFEDNLYFFLRMNRSHQNRVDTGTFCSENIREYLIAHKKRVLFSRSHPPDSFCISLRQRFSRLINVHGIHLLTETFHPRLLIVGDKAGLKAQSMKPPEQLYGAFIRRRSVGNEGIVDIKKDAPKALFI